MSNLKTVGAVCTCVLGLAAMSFTLAWADETKLPNKDAAASKPANEAPARSARRSSPFRSLRLK